MPRNTKWNNMAMKWQKLDTGFSAVEGLTEILRGYDLK